MYFLVRQDVPLFLAMAAALRIEEHATVYGWFTDETIDHDVCSVTEEEFNAAKAYGGQVIVANGFRGDQEVAIAFAPRDGDWPEAFEKFDRLFDEESAKARSEITEAIWLNCDTRPHDLANVALPRVSVRKVRLFGVACCDLVKQRMGDARSRRAVDVARRHADGFASDDELRIAADAADDAVRAMLCARPSGSVLGATDPETAAAALAANVTESLDRTPTPDSPDGWYSLCAGGGSISDFLISHTIKASAGDPLVRTKITGLLRDICGSPFRPATADRAWLTAPVVERARSLYETQEFDRLPALADALEEAGCTNDAILVHLRSAGPHVRGCWALDLILGQDG